MSEEKPTVYILRGDDREKIESLIRQFYEQLGSPEMAEMNTTRLEGKTADLNDLRAAGLALPFLADRRLVIVEDALDRVVREDNPKKGGKKQSVDEGISQRDKFLGFLDSLPPSTALVLVIPDFKKNKNRNGVWESEWVTLNPKHWLIRWAQEAGTRVAIVDCLLPTDRDMARWIEEKARALGGGFTKKAAQVLALYVGNNTQRAVQEITKLLTYVNNQRQVTDVDVENLCVNEMQASIFEMVDAIGHRNGKEASKLFHLLLEELDFTRELFPRVVNQFRFLIQAREILDSGGTQRDLYGIQGLLPFLVSKIFAQAQNFDLPTLEKIHHHLLEIDLGEKTGRMPGEVAMDMLIARLSVNNLL